MSALIAVDDALAAILAHRPSWGAEDCRLEDALGRLLAAPVVAKVTQPPLAVSAMDGYAVRQSDVAGGAARLRVIGESPAGQPFQGAIGPGEAVRIFTGGAVPDGADHIVIQENARRDGDQISVADPEAAPRHIRRAGMDFSAGDTLIPAGRTLEPAHLAAAAAANHHKLRVASAPRVALLANGDELRQPGSDLGPGEIIASSRFGLAGLIRNWGGEPIDLGIAADRVDDIQAHIDAAGDADILVPVGGASVGDHDHMRRAFDGLGYETVFAKVAVKPGKPTWFAAKAHQRVLGLPGNPASALVCAHLFLRPLLTGQSSPTRTARLDRPLSANGGRESYLRAKLELDDDGMLRVHSAINQDSALIHPFLSANALIRRVPNAPACAEGDRVEALQIAALS